MWVGHQAAQDLVQHRAGAGTKWVVAWFERVTLTHQPVAGLSHKRRKLCVTSERMRVLLVLQTECLSWVKALVHAAAVEGGISSLKGWVTCS